MLELSNVGTLCSILSYFTVRNNLLYESGQRVPFFQHCCVTLTCPNYTVADCSSLLHVSRKLLRTVERFYVIT